eukprot:129738_1
MSDTVNNIFTYCILIMFIFGKLGVTPFAKIALRVYERLPWFSLLIALPVYKVVLFLFTFKLLWSSALFKMCLPFNTVITLFLFFISIILLSVELLFSKSLKNFFAVVSVFSNCILFMFFIIAPITKICALIQFCIIASLLSSVTLVSLVSESIYSNCSVNTFLILMFIGGPISIYFIIFLCALTQLVLFGISGCFIFCFCVVYSAYIFLALTKIIIMFS